MKLRTYLITETLAPDRGIPNALKILHLKRVEPITTREHYNVGYKHKLK